MYYSTIFIFSFIVVVSLSEAIKWKQVQPLNSNEEPYDVYNFDIAIDNGVNRNGNIEWNKKPSEDTLSPRLNNRFRVYATANPYHNIPQQQEPTRKNNGHDASSVSYGSHYNRNNGIISKRPDPSEYNPYSSTPGTWFTTMETRFGIYPSSTANPKPQQKEPTLVNNSSQSSTNNVEIGKHITDNVKTDSNSHKKNFEHKNNRHDAPSIVYGLHYNRNNGTISKRPDPSEYNPYASTPGTWSTTMETRFGVYPSSTTNPKPQQKEPTLVNNSSQSSINNLEMGKHFTNNVETDSNSHKKSLEHKNNGHDAPSVGYGLHYNRNNGTMSKRPDPSEYNPYSSTPGTWSTTMETRFGVYPSSTANPRPQQKGLTRLDNSLQSSTNNVGIGKQITNNVKTDSINLKKSLIPQQKELSRVDNSLQSSTNNVGIGKQNTNINITDSNDNKTSLEHKNKGIIIERTDPTASRPSAASPEVIAQLTLLYNLTEKLEGIISQLIQESQT